MHLGLFSAGTLRLLRENRVYRAADQQGHRGKVHPQHQYDHGAERSVGLVIRIEILKVDAKAARKYCPQNDRNQSAGANPYPVKLFERRKPVRTRAKPKKPSQYKVLMLNDDYTPMEFVVMVLKRFFRMDLEQATRVMLHVHQKGVGVCGVFPYEVAETKVNQVMDFARQNQHPLQCTLEKA